MVKSYGATWAATARRARRELAVTDGFGAIARNMNADLCTGHPDASRSCHPRYGFHARAQRCSMLPAKRILT
jgi:hypothetical protein